MLRVPLVDIGPSAQTTMIDHPGNLVDRFQKGARDSEDQDRMDTRTATLTSSRHSPMSKSSSANSCISGPRYTHANEVVARKRKRLVFARITPFTCDGAYERTNAKDTDANTDDEYLTASTARSPHYNSVPSLYLTYLPTTPLD